MLSRLSIRNYALIDDLELEFDAGHSVLTGETGAGKSILLGALGLALGARADREAVARGADRADVAAIFEELKPGVVSWLEDRDLADDGACHLRRVVPAEGSSRAYVNGTPVTASQLRELGALLVEIHGQGENLRLARASAQRSLLDCYGDHEAHTAEVATQATVYRDLEGRLATLAEAGADPAQVEFLRFQLGEFEGLDVGADALSALEAEHRRAANAESIAAAANRALTALDGEGRALDDLNAAERDLNTAEDDDPTLAEARDLLESARIQAEEARQLVRHVAESAQVDPERLTEIEDRLSQLHGLARKHRVSISDLDATRQDLESNLETVAGSEEKSRALSDELDQAMSRWRRAADQLTRARRRAAVRLGRAANALLQDLGMTGAAIDIQVSQQASAPPSEHGADRVAIAARTNAGQKAGPLEKIASGGELARIGLALKVATTADDDVATLIFDEVDAGVGGATAEVVGRLLRRVAQRHQLLSVTHLPQVAALADHHYRVEKTETRGRTTTTVRRLTGDSREQELARMLGGVEITAKTLDHARDMLRRAQAA